MAAWPAPADSRRRCASPPAREVTSQEQVLGRDVLVAEAPGLVLGALDQRPGPRVEAELAALDAGAPRRAPRASSIATWAGSAPSWRSTMAGMPSASCEERGEDVLGVEHRALGARGELLGREDGLLGLLGIAIELHGGPSAAMRCGRATRPIVGARSAGRRGRRGPARGPRPSSSRCGGQHDAWRAREGRRGRRPRRVAGPGRRGGRRGPAGCRPGSSAGAACRRSSRRATSPPRSASPSVRGSSRLRFAPSRVNVRWGSTGTVR